MEKVGLVRIGIFLQAGIQDIAGKAEQIGHVGKEAGMARCAPEDPSVLILNFALNAAMAEGCVHFGGWDQGPRSGQWREAG